MKPLILVTNDDGVGSPGLAAAVRGARNVGDVLIAAPHEQHTAMGRAYPHRDDLGVIDRVRIDLGGETVEAFAVHGSPGYAAAYGIAEIAPKIKGRRPDITVSGINAGANCGTSITSSGTIGRLWSPWIWGCRRWLCRRRFSITMSGGRSLKGWIIPVRRERRSIGSDIYWSMGFQGVRIC